MDQRQLVKQLEDHFRSEEQAQLDHRKRVHEERGAQSDQVWWNELIEKTKTIRPQMQEVFERNKEEMIAKRHQTMSSETIFREKQIQKRVLELLPHVSAIRSESLENGELTSDQIRLAILRQSLDTVAPKVVEVASTSPDDPQMDFIDSLIEIQLRRKEELN